MEYRKCKKCGSETDEFFECDICGGECCIECIMGTDHDDMCPECYATEKYILPADFLY